MNNYQIRTYLLILCSFGCHRICLGQTVATEVGLEGTEIEKEIEMERGLEIRLHNLRMLQTITPGQNSPEIADALKNVGAAYQEIGDAKNAIKYFEDALQMERALYPGQNNINIAETLSNLGSASKQLGNDTLVIKYYEAALEMLRALYPAQNHQAINFALISIGWAYASMGDNAKALHYYEEALKVHKSLQGNYVGTGWILDQICKIYFETRNIEEIINYSEQALEVRKELFSGPNYTFIANSFNNLAFAYEEFGDIYKSAECLKVAFIMDRRTGGGPDTTQSTKRLVEFKYPDFIRNNETREFILQRGTFDKSTLQIKQKLQKTVLNEICKASSEGKWSSGSDVGLEKRGVKDYLDETYLRQQLGSLSNSETVEMAKMLCFEAICLGIMSSASKTKNFQCAREFANAYPAVIEDITKNHPEYFVDGSIVRECTNDPAVFKQMLGSQAAQLGKNALFLTSILCLLFMDV